MEKGKLKEIRSKLKSIGKETKKVSLMEDSYCVCYRRKDPLCSDEKYWLITGSPKVVNELSKHYKVNYDGRFFCHWNYYEISI